MVDVQLAVDLAFLCLSTATTIAGITPPSTATKEQKSRASSDFIGRTGLASQHLVYAAQAALLAVAATQAHILLHAKQPSSSPSGPALRWLATVYPSQKPLLSDVQHWLLDQTVRRNFRTASAVAMLGGILRVVCFRTLGQFFTFELAVKDGHKVIQTGPYAFVRHPSYTAMLLMCGGMLYKSFAFGPLIKSQYRSTAFYTITACVALLAFLIGLRIRDEEKMLQKELGKEYKEYMHKVPARLFPILF